MKSIKSDYVVIRPKTKSQLLSELNRNFYLGLNRLIKQSQPNRDRLHQLIRLVSNELGVQDYDEARRMIQKYYTIDFERRTAGTFWRVFGVKPYPWLHDQFTLNFSQAQVSDTELAKFAIRICFLLKNAIEVPKDLGQMDLLHLCLHKLVHPRADQKSSGLDFEDFVEIWQRTAFFKWGARFEDFFAELNALLRKAEPPTGADGRLPVSRGALKDIEANPIELTQLDLDWMSVLLISLRYQRPLPDYPLVSGAMEGVMMQLEKLVRAHQRIQAGQWKHPQPDSIAKAIQKLCTSCLEIYGQLPKETSEKAG